MGRILQVVLIAGCCACSRVWAETREQDRRVEEEKREALAPTVSPTPTSPVIPPKTSEADVKPPAPLPIAALYFAMAAQKRIVYNYDAAKAMVILMQVDEEYIALDAQVGYLREQGLIPRRAAFDPALPLRRGLLAYMVRQALGVPGGVALHLFGPSQRYALKELSVQGLISPGLTRDLISGEEFVQVMNQAVQYRLLTIKPAVQQGS